MINKTKYHDTLVSARNILTESGWTQGMCQNSYDGSLCLVGSINKALSGNAFLASEEFPLTKEFTNLVIFRNNLLKLIEKDYISIDQKPHQWNDYRYRTFDEVINLLDRLIRDTDPNFQDSIEITEDVVSDEVLEGELVPA